MMIKPIDVVPSANNRRKRDNNNLVRKMIRDFYESDLDCAIVEFDSDEYSGSSSMYSSVRKAVQSLDYPLDAFMIRGEVYLKRIMD